MPDYDERGNITGYRQDAQGQALLSRLDEVALQQIADSGGGRYFRTADSGQWPVWQRKLTPSKTRAFKASSTREKWSVSNCFC